MSSDEHTYLPIDAGAWMAGDLGSKKKELFFCPSRVEYRRGTDVASRRVPRALPRLRWSSAFTAICTAVSENTYMKGGGGRNKAWSAAASGGTNSRGHCLLFRGSGADASPPSSITGSVNFLDIYFSAVNVLSAAYTPLKQKTETAGKGPGVRSSRSSVVERRS